jgi:hypothetical protein
MLEPDANGKERAVLVTTAHRGVFFGFRIDKNIRPQSSERDVSGVG